MCETKGTTRGTDDVAAGELQADVLVAGGGIAGIAAAAAAARGGKNVLLIEREYGLGGMATLGLVTIFLPLCDGNGRQLVYGLGEELLKLSIKHGAEANYPHAWLDGGSDEEKKQHRYLVQFNPHLFALAAERFLIGLGVNILYGTLCTGVDTADGRIERLYFENKSGRGFARAASYIDCTGDADICALSSAPTALHSGGNGLASWYYYLDAGKAKLKMFGLADKPPKNEGAHDGAYDAAITESIGDMRFSGVNGSELSSAVIAAHEKMYEDILAEMAISSDCVPVTISSIPLVRMSRRLAGEYTLDESEAQKPMADSIGMTGDWRKRGPAFEIPFGTLYTQAVKNLLAAGRDISVTDAMWDVTRVIPPCAVTGEAAGTAASITSDFTTIEIAKLQKRLVASGVKLHLADIPR
ncbi:MAG: FAD-dependent oxidoreductase [Clostridiales Family XIII bacterium]|jgi:hypothetical protein|nr:FAD-dependent oxidoreductase [Clostridiales Family XIII bacterium]